MHIAVLRLIVSVLTCLSALPLLANGGGYTKGIASTGAFKPFGIEQVEMLSERLEIDLHIEYAEVRIEYVLHNPGPKVTVEAGFPVALRHGRHFMGPNTAPEINTLKLEDFELAADGKTVPVSVVPDDVKLSGARAESGKGDEMTIKAWHVFKLPFKPGESRRVTVRYRNPYALNHTYVSEDETVGPLTMAYIFSSAAAWSGPIKQGVVTVRAVTANPSQVEFNLPNRFTRTENTWQWMFTDLEPTLEDDLAIIARRAFYRETLYFENPETGDLRGLPISHLGWEGKRREEENYPSGPWELHRQDYKATATSTLAAREHLRYDPELLAMDRLPSTAWAEGVEGNGVGESVTLVLPKPAKVRKVGLVNGYAESKDLYFANNRVSKLQVSVDGGANFEVDVPDEVLTTERFYFDLPETKEPVKTIKLTIAGVYKGSQHDDTCLSEVVLVVPLEKKPKLQPSR